MDLNTSKHYNVINLFCYLHIAKIILSQNTVADLTVFVSILSYKLVMISSQHLPIPVNNICYAQIVIIQQYSCIAVDIYFICTICLIFLWKYLPQTLTFCVSIDRIVLYCCVYIYLVSTIVFTISMYV